MVKSKASKKSSKRELAALKRIYREAWNEGVFLREFGGDAQFMTAAGSVKKLEKLEKQVGREIDVYELNIADCIGLGALPGVGPTRIAACRDALRIYRAYVKTHKKAP